MDVSALLAEYRRLADDKVEPYIVSDEEAIRLAAEAENEACLRAKLIYDFSTPRLAEYEVQAGQATVKLSPSVFQIDGASWKPATAGREKEVCVTGIDAIMGRGGWRSRTHAYVDAAAMLERNQLRLFPIPSVGGTLYLSVYRLPLFALEAGGDEPEIAEEHHLGLIDWMLYRTWSAKDSEQEDPQRAANALAAFEQRFGELPQADVMRKHREKRRANVRYGGI